MRWALLHPEAPAYGVGMNFNHLPKRLQNRPDVRALGLSVYRNGSRSFQVPGRQQIYDVFLVDSTIHCSCRAASHGRTCAHSLAVARYLKENS